MLTERPPGGREIGPLRGTPVRRIDSNAAAGNGSVSAATPSRCSIQSMATPVAASTRRVASVHSGPMPSPGITVTGRFTGRTASLAPKHHRVRGQPYDGPDQQRNAVVQRSSGLGAATESTRSPCLDVDREGGDPKKSLQWVLEPADRSIKTGSCAGSVGMIR